MIKTILKKLKMKNQYIILISGKSRSGKSTIAQYLHDKYNGELFHLGAGVRNVAREIYNIQYDILFNEKMKNKKINVFDEEMTVRELLQKVGYSLKEALGKDIWCKKLYYEKLKNHDYNLIIIDDYRFNEEYEFFLNKGYKVLGLKVIRNNAENDNKNICENQKLKIDYTIYNNGNLDELYKQIDQLMIKSHIPKINNNKINYNYSNSLPFWEWLLEEAKKEKNKIITN